MAQKTMAEAQAKVGSKREEFEAQVAAITDAVEHLNDVDAKKIDTSVLESLKSVMEHGIEAYSLANEIAVVRNLYGIHGDKAAKPAAKAAGLFRR